MKNLLKRKRVLFPIIFFGQILVFILLSAVFSYEFEDTTLNLVPTFAMLATFIWFLLKVSRDYKEKLSSIKIPPFNIPIVALFYLVVVILIINSAVLAFRIISGFFT